MKASVLGWACVAAGMLRPLMALTTRSAAHESAAMPSMAMALSSRAGRGVLQLQVRQRSTATDRVLRYQFLI